VPSIVVYSIEHSYSISDPDQLGAPLIPVTLIYDGLDVTILATMDSGAAISVFPRSIAASLRIDLSRYEEKLFGTVKSGVELKLRLVDLTMDIAGIRLDSTVAFWFSDVGVG